MAVTTTTNSIEYDGNDSAYSFPIPFRFLDASHLEVVAIGSGGVSSLLGIGVDYIVTGAGTSSGSIVLSVAPATGTQLRIRRVVPKTQPTTFRTSGLFSPRTHEDAFDRVVMQVQELDGRVNDAVAGVLPPVDLAEARTAVAQSALTASTAAASASADAAATSADASVAVAARVSAELARDAAAVSGGLYANTAAGIAAVADGAYFIVGSTQPTNALIIYQRVGAGSVEVTRYPSVSAINAIGEVLDPTGYVWVVTDNADRVLLGIEPDGTVVGKGLSSSEILDARGSRADLDTRLSTGLAPYGYAIRHVWGEWTLRETRRRIRSRLLSESAQLVVAAIGDSWTDGYDRWANPTWRSLKDLIGDAGPGWIGLTWGGGPAGSGIQGNVDYLGIPVTYSNAADWTSQFNAASGPSICSITSSTVGTQVTVSGGPAGCSDVRLHYIATAGNLRYRWNGGGWNALTLSGTGAQVASLATVPAGAWTLDLEVVAGPVTLCGLDARKASDGIRFHKLGSAGSQASQWANATAAYWQNAITDLAPHLVVVMLGTNDQAAYIAADFKGYVQTVITRIRAAVPKADILLVAPCENGAGRTRPMADYATALFELAVDNHCAALDLQYVFGETYSEYAYGSDRPWFVSDLIHPDTATGGRAIADAIVRVLTQS